MKRTQGLALAASLLGVASGCDQGGIDRTRFIHRSEHRARCADRDPLRQPRFGDLHVHTSLSFDAAVAQVRAKPEDAYRFAKGMPLGLPPFDTNGNPAMTVQLTRPLDFTAVTDHSEFLAEVSICQDPTALTYDSYTCRSYRDSIAAMMFSAGTLPLTLITDPPMRQDVCQDPFDLFCRDRLDTVWAEAVAMTEANDDRTSDCGFATLIGYEWTGTRRVNNWHRNVIFGGSTVPIRPVSFVEAWSPERLWDALHAECLDAGVGCDVVVIPHNLNISGGMMFETVGDDGQPYTAPLAQRRRELEPLAEIYQHKGASECSPGMGGLASSDEECAFELLVPTPCTGTNDPPGCTPTCAPLQGGGFLGTCVSPNDFARAALRTGLAQQATLGQNPFEFGFIGSTDTHNATPGYTRESTWRGHAGIQDASSDARLGAPVGIIAISRYSSPGGLAVAWSEENSRPSIFAALKRRETYATSGTRIVLRLFGGFGLDANLCASADLASAGYASGVPMGGVLPPTSGSAAPSFVVNAAKDGESADLQRVEIVKGWYDGTTTHEQVYVVAGDANNGASVDLATCSPTGAGAAALCQVWSDPDFDPTEPAFYYARVLENPTCRWHRYLCNQLAVDCSTVGPTSPEATCCNGVTPDTVQERAWSSPIWYYPPSP